MEKNMNKESWINMVMATILGIILIYLSRSFGFLVYSFQVFPFIVLYVNDGWKKTALSLAITFIVAYFILDTLSLIYIALSVILVTIYAGQAIINKKNITEIILNATLINVALTLLSFLAAYYITKVNPIEETQKIIELTIKSMVENLDKGLTFSAEEIENYEIVLRQSANAAMEISPAILFIVRYIMTAINIFLGIHILKKIRDDVHYVTKLNLYVPGRGLKFATVSLLVLGLVLYLIGYEYRDLFIQNSIAILGFFYFLNGFFVSDFVYERGKRKVLRIILPIIILVFLRGYLVYVIIGLLDLVLNFRRRILTNGSKRH